MVTPRISPMYAALVVFAIGVWGCDPNAVEVAQDVIDGMDSQVVDDVSPDWETTVVLDVRDACADGASECGGECVDLLSSSVHCGTCNHSCADDQTCVSGECVGCVSACVPGQRRCAQGENAVQECVELSGCGQWGAPRTCEGGLVCDGDGQCVQQCQHQCDQVGQTVCDATGVGTRTCAEIDGDPCRDLTDSIACPANHVCENGMCIPSTTCQDECQVGEQRCAADAPEQVPMGSQCDCDAACAAPMGYTGMCVHGICMVRGQQDCAYSGSPDECPANARCWGGTGVPICYPDCGTNPCAGDCDEDNSCVRSPSMDCYATCGTLCDRSGSPPSSVEGIQACGNHDADSCREWGGATPCPAGSTCNPQSNQCEQSTPPGDVEWLDYGAQHGQTNATWGSVLTDIVQHCPSEWVSTYYDSDKVTHGHETTHGINANLRNYHNDTGLRANGFYVLENRGAIVVEPNIRKSQVGTYVPASLRGARYALYITGMSDWDDTPLYVWDEWVSYTNGTAVAVDLSTHNMWSYGWRDACAGTIEFIGYAVAVGMAVEVLDASYFADYEQFRAFLQWQLVRSMDLFQRCRVIPDFAWDEQDQLYQNLRSSSDAEAMRGFITRTFGEAFANELLN